MYNFMCQIVPIFTKRIDTFWSRGIMTFCPKKSDKIHKDI